MQVDAAVNQGTAFFGTVRRKNISDVATDAALVYSDQILIQQSRDDDNFSNRNEEEKRAEGCIASFRCLDLDFNMLAESEESSDECEHIYNWQAVIEQIRANPALVKTGSEGVLPLHAACGASAPIFVIKFLLEKYPEAAQAKCDKGYLPIFYHLDLNKESPSEEVLLALLEAYPGAAAVVNPQNQLPIHLVCKAKGVSEKIFTTLLRANPEGAYVCDDDRKYPVDYAVANKDVVTRKVALASLFKNAPGDFLGTEKEETAHVEDVIMTIADVHLLHNGGVPKTELVNVTDEVINDILTSFTQETEESSHLMKATSAELKSLSPVVDEKSLLLHLENCLEMGSSLSASIVAELVGSFPSSASMSNASEQLPIHLACMAKDVPENIFTVLLRAYPAGAYLCDDNNMYPIDYAIANKDAATKKKAIAALVQNDAYVNLVPSPPTVPDDASPPSITPSKVTAETSPPSIISEVKEPTADRIMISQSPDDDVPPAEEKKLTSEEREISAEELEEIPNEAQESPQDIIYNWQAVLEQIRANPALVKTGSEGVLPLHAACGAGAPIFVIKFLLEKYPEAAQAKCDKGYLPIFYHLDLNKESPSEEVLLALLEAYPGAAAVVNPENQLPIHLVCKAKGVSEKIFTTLLRANPDGAYVCDDDGKYPVDYAVANDDETTKMSAKVAFVKLLENFKATLSPDISGEEGKAEEQATCWQCFDLDFNNEEDSMVESVLTIPSRSINYNWQAVLEQIRANPALVKTGSEGVLPLHAACGAGAPIFVIKFLLEKYPEAAQAKCDKGYLPIFYHLDLNKESPSEEVLLALLEAYPGAAAVVNPENQLPIHLACKAKGVSEKIFTTLLRANPDGAYVCDDDGKYPVDYAVANDDETTKMSAKVAFATFLQNAASSSPTIVVSPCTDEENSLEGDSYANVLSDVFACNSSPPGDSVLSLIADNPNLVRSMDADNQLPIHHACKAKYVSEETFSYILGAYPEGAYVLDKFGKYPIDYAVANKDTGTRMNAIAALFQNDVAMGLAPKQV